MHRMYSLIATDYTHVNDTRDAKHRAGNVEADKIQLFALFEFRSVDYTNTFGSLSSTPKLLFLTLQHTTSRVQHLLWCLFVSFSFQVPTPKAHWFSVQNNMDLLLLLHLSLSLSLCYALAATSCSTMGKSLMDLYCKSFSKVQRFLLITCHASFLWHFLECIPARGSVNAGPKIDHRRSVVK